jgi:UDP-2,3-diacylglucosamine pyrophosphatase LpxH
MGRIVFISDCHISAGLGQSAGGGFAWEWLTPSDQERLRKFLVWTAARAAQVDELVLVGDIFDNWIFPHDLVPPTLSEILHSAYARPIIQALDAASRVVPTTLLAGNHDLTLSADLVAQVLPKVRFAGAGSYTMFSGRLRAEHGHAWGLFNAPDPQRPDNLPLGYFISRMVATADRRTGHHTPSIAQEIKELAQVIATREELAQGVLDAVCAKAGVSENAEILMPTDLWGGHTTTVRDVRDLYRELYVEWKKRNGMASSIIGISAELNSLAMAAARIQLDGDGPRALLMGHTHEPASQQHTIPFMGSRVYVNSGTWCQNVKHATWVEAEDKGGGLELTVFGCTGFASDGSPVDLVAAAGPVKA